MFKKGDLVKTTRYFNDQPFVCIILNSKYDNDLIQVWCMEHKTIYYIFPTSCDLL
jgi:hypothetical protein